MKRSKLIAATSIVLGGLSFAGFSHAQAPATQPTAASSPTTAPAAESADGILSAFDAIKPPKFDASRQSDRAYIQEFYKQLGVAQQKRAALAKQFVEKYPDHDRAGEMLLVEVQSQASVTSPGSPEGIKLIQDFLAAHPTTSAKSKLVFQKALIVTRSDAPYEQKTAAIAEFDAVSPKDPRTLSLTSMAIDQLTGDQKVTEMKKFIAANAGTQAAKSMEGSLRRADGVGKPFELSFDEAVTGKHMDVQKDLKGKIVVIDFWATWCGPCVGEMPNNKKLYAEFKDKGVEFIGVSLDQPEDKGGKKSLLAFVEKNKITWPQYYQGNFWSSQFSTSWGINSIPAVFVVDADGKLYSTDARGKLEKILPELIKKRDSTAAE